MCDTKKLIFIKKKEANGLLSSSGIKKPLSKIPLVNKFVLARDKSMPEMHLRQPFTYSACEPFTRNKERIQKFKETGHSKYTY